MKYVKDYECTLCHKTFPKTSTYMTCPECGELGILDIRFDYEQMKKEVNLDYFKNNQEYSIWRYLPFLTVTSVDPKSTLSVGWSPLYSSSYFEKTLGVNKLYFKDDGQNPTSSLKDRASIVAVMKAKELGYDTIACSSTGNAASSLAGNAAKCGLKTVIFVPKRAPLGKLAQLKAFGTTLVKVDGDYKAAFTLSKLAINKYGWYNRNAAINPHLVEGKKTVALEIAEQLEFNVCDWVCVSVGDGCTIASVYKGFYDLFQLGLIAKIPKLLGIQAKGCSPFVKAFNDSCSLKESKEDTIADSIAVGIPRNPVKAINAITKSSGMMISVTDEEILSALKELGAKEGIFAEPAASASFAGYLKAIQKGFILKSETVTVIITGNGLKDTTSALSAFKEERNVLPNLEDLQIYLKENIR
ncbi:MAG: threonine synthase [Candidatus Izemoplasmatales bacterium]|jgi:threonine synthase|nr:threonine synthase [Candidatus Izemoplasmatales bacterium]